MKNFHIKSIILGMGIGIVLTSVISMIYLAGSDPSQRITTEQIREEAKKLGMIDSTELISSSDNTGQSQAKGDNDKPSSNEPVKDKEAVLKPADNDSVKLEPNEKTEDMKPRLQEITVRISPGDSSQVVADKLLRSGLIADKGDFIRELTRNKLESKINIGEFKIKTGTDVRGIIKILTEL